jgi:hypothetical protein
MSIFDWIIGIVLLGFLLVWTIGGLVELVPFVTVGAYRELRYGRKGICWKCKEPYAMTIYRHADQMYGPDQISKGICPCGASGLWHGNRHFAEW